jgi:hypothetical protein
MNIPVFTPTQKYIIISALMLIIGIGAYAFYNEVIIIRIPTRKAHYISNEIDRHKKKYALFIRKDNNWHKEEKELITTSKKLEMLTYLITNWLQFATEEKMQKKTLLESIMLDNNQVEAYIDFDRNPFSKESSTYEKWMWIESLLKTLKESGIQIQSVKFLVNHKQLFDYHLDFSQAWPITGFI